MKKLSLKNLKLNESNILERNQLKSVFGGYGSNSGGYDDGQPCSILATASVFEENRHYGGVSNSEADEAWNFYYDACMSVGHENYTMPVFL